MTNEWRTLCRRADAWSGMMTPGAVAMVFYYHGDHFMVGAYKLHDARGHWIVRVMNNDALLRVDHAIIPMAAVNMFTASHILASEAAQDRLVYCSSCLFYTSPQISRQDVMPTLSKVQFQARHCRDTDENDTN